MFYLNTKESQGIQQFWSQGKAKTVRGKSGNSKMKKLWQLRILFFLMFAIGGWIESCLFFLDTISLFQESKTYDPKKKFSLLTLFILI